MLHCGAGARATGERGGPRDGREIGEDQEKGRKNDGREGVTRGDQGGSCEVAGEVLSLMEREAQKVSIRELRDRSSAT
jgi:hypothetical protein